MPTGTAFDPGKEEGSFALTKGFPRITVIVASMNRADTIGHLIESVAAQDYDNRELIIIDGGSKDDTVAILRANESRIDYWESEPDHGSIHAWNKALRKATGEWVCVLGADDYLWDPHVLQRLAAAIRSRKAGERLVHGQVAQVDEDGRTIRLLGGPPAAHTDPKYGIVPIPSLGLLYDRSLFESYGTFDESFMISGDVDFILRVTRREKVLFVPDLVAVGMRMGGTSTSVRNALAAVREVRRAYRHNGLQARIPPGLVAYAVVQHALIVLVGERWHRWISETYRTLKARVRQAS